MKKLASARIDSGVSVDIALARNGDVRIEWVRTDNTVSYVTRIRLSNDGARDTLMALHKAFTIIDGQEPQP